MGGQEKNGTSGQKRKSAKSLPLASARDQEPADANALALVLVTGHLPASSGVEQVADTDSNKKQCT